MVKPRVGSGNRSEDFNRDVLLQVDGAGLGREVQHRVEFSVTHEPVTTIKFLLKDRSGADQRKEMNQ